MFLIAAFNEVLMVMRLYYNYNIIILFFNFFIKIGEPVESAVLKHATTGKKAADARTVNRDKWFRTNYPSLNDF
jgi:hypothetical protein